MVDIFNTRQRLHKILMKLKKTHREFRILNHLKISVTGKTSEKNNLTIVVNVWYIKEMEICPAYFSKYNSTRKKEITMLRFSNGKGWHYLAVKNCLHY